MAYSTPAKCLLISLLLATSVIDVQGADRTYSCTAVQDKASVGVSSGHSVSVTTGTRTCNFSVDGASTDANARQAFLGAMNELLAGNLDNLSRSSPNRDALKALLLESISIRRTAT